MKKKKEQTLLDKITFSFDKIILGNIILTVLFLIFGIIVYLNPVMTLKTLGVFIGIYFSLFGLFNIYEFFMRKESPIFSLKIILGIIALVLGLFTIINPFKIVKLVTFALGIYLTLLGIFKILDALKLKKYGFDGWLIVLVVSVLITIFGVFVGINPMASVSLVEVTSIFIILSSILEICELLVLYTKAKSIMKLLK